MHPYISQSLMDARSRPARAAAARAGAGARRPPGGPCQDVAARPLAQPALEALPVADRALTH